MISVFNDVAISSAETIKMKIQVNFFSMGLSIDSKDIQFVFEL